MKFEDWGLMMFWFIAAVGYLYSAVDYLKLNQAWFFVGVVIVCYIFVVYAERQEKKKH